MTRHAPTRRRTVANALRFVRSARTAAWDAEVRYHRRELAAAAIRRAKRALNAAEAALLGAQRHARRGERRAA